MVRVDGGGANSLIQVRGLDKTYHRGGGEIRVLQGLNLDVDKGCLLYTSPSPRDLSTCRMPSSA